MKLGLDPFADAAYFELSLFGLDIYDPTTGQIRSHSTDDIACWFVDTNYNGESFFVRHAYFTGGDQPYEKTKTGVEGGDRRSGVECALPHPEPSLPGSRDGQNRGKSYRSLRV